MPAGTRMPIVALTANASKAEIRRCQDIGIDDYMTKPLQLADLHAMLADMDAGRCAAAAVADGPDAPAGSPASRRRLPASRPGQSPAVDLTMLTALVGSDPK